MTATIIFPTRRQAESFCSKWSRNTRRGHTIGAGLERVKVTLHNVTEGEKQLINHLVSQRHKTFDSKTAEAQGDC